MLVFEEFGWDLGDEVLIIDHTVAGGDSGVYIVGEILVTDTGAAVVIQLGDFFGLGLELDGVDDGHGTTKARAGYKQGRARILRQQCECIWFHLRSNRFICRPKPSMNPTILTPRILNLHRRKILNPVLQITRPPPNNHNPLNIRKIPNKSPHSSPKSFQYFNLH